MTELYFSDRERGPRPRVAEAISPKVWLALRQLIANHIQDNSFGYRFPEMCSDGAGPCGCNAHSFTTMLLAEVPDLNDENPLYSDSIPDPVVILDILEFCARAVGKPIERGYHPFMQHYHLAFDRDAGLADFVAAVNLLLARNGIAFELSSEGQARRIAPPGLREELATAVFHTGDPVADALLEDARRRILSPHPNDRQDALEKLWDAFERIKTLEPGAGKPEQVRALLDRTASSPKMRQYLENEARELTAIGNNLRIRHAETSQEQIQQSEHIDYLFHRMLSFLRLVLRMTGRGG